MEVRPSRTKGWYTRYLSCYSNILHIEPGESSSIFLSAVLCFSQTNVHSFYSVTVESNGCTRTCFGIVRTSKCACKRARLVQVASFQTHRIINDELQADNGQEKSLLLLLCYKQFQNSSRPLFSEKEPPSISFRLYKRLEGGHNPLYPELERIKSERI